MDLLVFGHAGARVIVFPTSMGSFVEYRDRGMIAALGRHIESGWLQVFCVDSFDSQSWYAEYLPPPERIRNHVRYERYILDEVLPFTRHRNDNPFLIATGCSFGAFHAMLLGLRHPETVGRVVGLSGAYDPRRWLDGYDGVEAYFVDPIRFIGGVTDPLQRARLADVDIIFAVGRDDPSFESNVALSASLASAGLRHAFRVWDGWAHDWPYWSDMILHYIGGPDSR
jgi:esterase/lipase superfamily enzyme